MQAHVAAGQTAEKACGASRQMSPVVSTMTRTTGYDAFAGEPQAAHFTWAKVPLESGEEF